VSLCSTNVQKRLFTKYQLIFTVAVKYSLRSKKSRMAPVTECQENFLLTSRLRRAKILQRTRLIKSSTNFSQLPHLHTFITSHPSSQYSLFIHRYSCSATFIILPDRSFHYASPCLRNKRPFVSSSTSFWYQLLHFRLIYSFTHHFFLF